MWSKTPLAIDAFDRGALIRPKGGGKFLAIATGFNAARRWRGRGDKGLPVTPAQMVASGEDYIGGGALTMCLVMGRIAGRSAVA